MAQAKTIYGQTYEQVVAEAAEIATTHARELGRQGICGPLRLYWKPGKLALQSTLISHSMEADGWSPTSRELPASIPFTFYARWIQQNSGDLPIFTGAQ